MDFLWDNRDWIGFALVLTAKFMAGSMNRWCWIVGLSSCPIWISIAIEDGRYGFLAMNFVLACMDISNFMRWTKKMRSGAWEAQK